MRKVFKALRVLLVVVVILFVLVIGINRYNTKKYSLDGPDYTNPQTVLEQGNVSFVEGQYLRGFHFPPAEQTHPGMVVVFGGSEGGPNYQTARNLQDQGYNVLSLYFFGQPGQQEKLSQVPLDFFDEVLSWIETNGDPTGPLTLIGASKGAELVENLAANYPEVDNFIAFTPSEYTYQGLAFGSEPKSSFTYRQQPLPFLEFPKDYTINTTMLTRFVLGLPISFRPSYENAVAVATEDERNAARIDLSNFEGNGLLFAGNQDAMWQAEIAAQNVAAQNPNIEAIIYPDAGHVFADDITTLGPSWEVMAGGTLEGNRLAAEKSRQVVAERLNQWHSKR